MLQTVFPQTQTSVQTRVLINLGLGLILAGLLYWAGSFSFPLFHLFAEGFSIVISLTVFLLVLNVRSLLQNSFLTFIGIGYFAVGILDGFHTAATAGMNVFPGYGLNLTTQFWIAARLVEMLSLLAGLAFFRRRRSFAATVLVYLAVTVGLVSLILTRNFPEMYRDGFGLTDLKRGLEYFLIATLLASIVLLIRYRRDFSQLTFRFLLASFIITIGSEFCFTLYVGPLDLFNQVGHYLKFLSFFLIYKAIVHVGLQEPYRGIFHQLTSLNEDLEAKVRDRTREVEESAEQFRNTIFSLPSSLVLLRWEGATFRLEQANQTARASLGAVDPAADPLAAMPFPVTPELRQRLIAVALGSEGPFQWESQGRADRSFEVRAFQTKPAHLALLCLDTTEKKKTDHHLAQSARLESLGVLAGGIAHDFNNLLSGIFGYVQLASYSVQTGDTSRALTQLAKAESVFYRAKDLAGQLLTFSKGGAPITRIQPLQPILKQASDFVLSGQSARCRLDCPPDLWPANVDENQLSQVLQNLILNGVQAGASELQLTARNCQRADRAGDWVEIQVTDQGPGMSAETLAHVFEPFFTTKATGNGLGLTIVYSIIKKHGGLVEVSSEVGRGTSFRLFLPRASEPVPASSTVDPLTARFAGRVLIMDDDTDVVQILPEMLSHLGLLADSCASGTAAIERFRAAVAEGQPYDLVILDLTVKGDLGGLEALEQLRQINPSVKTIVSSGYAASANLAEYRHQGFNGVLAKPYRVADLVRVLGELL